MSRQRSRSRIGGWKAEKWQIDSEKERAEIEAILQVFPIRLLPPDLKLFLEDLEGHMESLWDLGGPVYAPRP